MRSTTYPSKPFPRVLPSTRRAFTLVELLVVVLILSVLMAVALPLYASSVEHAAKKTCRANMQSIVIAAQAWKVKNRMRDFSNLTDIDDLNSDLGSQPKTPNGATYILVASGNDVYKEDMVTPVTVPAGSIGVASGSGVGECGGFAPGMMAN